MQCMATAMTAVGAAGGIRGWLASKQPDWLTPRRLKAITAGLLTVAVLASGVQP
jgi:hypothetical protein